MARIYLAEVTAYDPALPGLVTLRYASGLGYNDPSAPGFYDPRLVEPGQIRRDLFGSGTTLGAVEIGYGELRLANLDGALDGLLDYGFDGRLLRVLVGDDAAAYGTFIVLSTGTMLAPAITEAEITLVLRDRLFELDKPLLTSRYGGTNVLPAGVDGTDDIKAQIIPRAYGVNRGLPAKRVNTALDIFQLSDRATDNLSRVYDNLIQLPKEGPDYTDLTDLTTPAHAPTPGKFRALLGPPAMFRLGAPAAGLVAADSEQGAAPADRTTAQILKRIALDAGVDVGDIDAGDVTALDVANPAEVGIWVFDEKTARQVMEEIAASIGAWFGFDRLGKLRMGRLAAPTGAPVATLKKLTADQPAEAGAIDLVSFALVPSNDADRGLPIYRVTVDFGKCYAPQPAATDAAITPAVRGRFAAEYQSEMAEDLSVQTAHPQAPELRIATLLHGGGGAAQTEAQRQLALRKVRRQRAVATVRLGTFAAGALDLGVVVKVQVPRFGMGAGRLFVVTGMTLRLAANLVDLDLWG